MIPSVSYPQINISYFIKNSDRYNFALFTMFTKMKNLIDVSRNVLHIEYNSREFGAREYPGGGGEEKKEEKKET